MSSPLCLPSALHYIVDLNSQGSTVAEHRVRGGEERVVGGGGGGGGGVTRRSRRPRRKELRRCTSVLARAISQLSGKVIINIVWHTRGRFGSHSAPAASDIAQMLSVPANPIHAASSQPYSLQLTASPSLQHLGRILHNSSRQWSHCLLASSPQQPPPPPPPPPPLPQLAAISLKLKRNIYLSTRWVW